MKNYWVFWSMVWFQCVICWDTSPGTNLHVLKLMRSTHPSHLWEKGMEPARPIYCHASKFFIFGHFCFSNFNNNPLPLCSLSHQNSKIFFWKISILCVCEHQWKCLPMGLGARGGKKGYWSWSCGNCELPYLCVSQNKRDRSQVFCKSSNCS